MNPIPTRPQERAQWWLAKLEPTLQARHADMKRFDDYYAGEHPLPFLTPAHAAKLRNEFRRLLEESRTNFSRLVVDVVEERLRPEGFRLSASKDAASDNGAWDIWQANQMDSNAPVSMVEALVKGLSYLSVWYPQAGEKYPVIAVEDPMQTIVGYEPGSNYRRRAAALKVFEDDWTGTQRANVYLPEGIFKFERAAREGQETHATDLAALNSSFGQKVTDGARRLAGLPQRPSWKELADEHLPNPFGVIPIIPIRNRPRLRCEGESEITDVVEVQNQINGFLFLLALAGYYGAHRQRWAAGFSPMGQAGTADETALNTATDSLWWTERPATEVKFGDFEQTSLDGYIKAIEQKILHIAVTTRTPRHYLIEQGQSPSGDAIKSAESGLVKKVERKMRPFGEGFEEAIRLARLFQGETASPVDSEIVWADAEIRSEAEITDAAIKRFQAGISTWQQTAEDVGYTQTQIERMSQSRDDELVAQQQPQQEAATLVASSVEALRVDLLAAIDEVRSDAQDLRAVVAEFGSREVLPPQTNITFADGAISTNINEGAVQTAIEPGAVQVDSPVTVEAPPPAQITVEVPTQEPPVVNVHPAPARKKTATLSDGRTITIEEE